MKFKLVYLASILFGCIISLNLTALSLICEAAENNGLDIYFSKASFLLTDGYTNRSVKTCKGRDCDGVDNFKYCRSPQDQFILKSFGKNEGIFIVANRCDGGFKKYESVGPADPEEKILMEEKMVYQMRNQIWGGTAFMPQPVLILSIDNDKHTLKIEDFTEDLWQEEWSREDIDVSAFVSAQDAMTYKTTCKITK